MTTFVSLPVEGPVTMNLPFAASSAGEARHALGDWLTELGYDDGIVDDALLVITELVANAVTHARPLAEGGLFVGWQRLDSRLLLTVRDGGGETVPTRVIAGPDSLGGRGMAIVDVLGSTWSVQRDRYGSAVHVRLDLPRELTRDLPRELT